MSIKLKRINNTWKTEFDDNKIGVKVCLYQLNNTFKTRFEFVHNEKIIKGK
jgi:hypothetical protein